MTEQLSINNLASILAAAKVESEKLRETPVVSDKSTNIENTSEKSASTSESSSNSESSTSTESNSSTESSSSTESTTSSTTNSESNPNSESTPNLAMPSAADISDFINKNGVTSIMDKLGKDPQAFTGILQNAMGSISPDMMEQAKKMMNSGQGTEIIKELQKRGMDPHTMRKNILDQQKAMRGMVKKGNTVKALYINNSRQVKLRDIPSANIKLSVTTILKSEQVIEIPCSRLAIGPWKGAEVKLWYIPNGKVKNRKANKLAGFPVNGEIIILVDSVDITEAHLQEIDDMLE
jgi:hypothetical protein